MLTKKQKIEHINKGKDLLGKSRTLIFTDFTGTSVAELSALRRTLLSLGAKFTVIKKRLMRIALKEQGIDFDPVNFDAQVGTIFTNKDISEIAGSVYKFSKFKDIEKKGFKILGGYDLAGKSFLDAEMVKRIGQLPSREILLGQLVGMLASPIKVLMYVLSEKSKMVEK